MSVMRFLQNFLGQAIIKQNAVACFYCRKAPAVALIANELIEKMGNDDLRSILEDVFCKYCLLW